MLRGRLFQMLRTVEFNDESPREADELDDVRTERGLSAELVPVDLPCTQEEPQLLLGVRGDAAESAGEVALVVVAVHDATLLFGAVTGRVPGQPPSPALPSEGEGAG
jgi:hypothetical protein